MKKILFALVALVNMLFSSCSNDAIEISTSEGKVDNALSISISPSKFFSTYNYVDTKHSDIKSLQETFRTFNSEENMLIEARSYFYKKSTGMLVDSVKTFVDNASNDITLTANLPKGDYYAISFINFAESDKEPYWYVKNKEKLETATLEYKYAYSYWNILSLSTDEFSVTDNKTVSITTTPSPVGAIIFSYFQNFYRESAGNNAPTDNGIRRLSIYARNKAIGYKLNPNAANRFEYLSDAGENSWYFLVDMKPEYFGEGNNRWTFFQTNLYSYDYVLTSESDIEFGYTLKGENEFQPYGLAKYSIQPGKMYLAYWNYLQVGNPYFGFADNNHWGTSYARPFGKNNETEMTSTKMLSLEY